MGTTNDGTGGAPSGGASPGGADLDAGLPPGGTGDPNDGGATDDSDPSSTPDPHIPPPPPSSVPPPPPPPPAPPSTLPQDPPPPSPADVAAGQDNHVSPAAGTPFTGPLPDWVLGITTTEKVPDFVVTHPRGVPGGGPKTKRSFQLYSFPFLGIGFLQGNIKAVNRGMLKRLQRAQEDLYRQYRQEQGAPANDADDQKKFRAFCMVTEAIGGQGPRGGGNHRDGSACDIEYRGSPWVPIFGPGGVLTGEQSNDSGPWSKANVWEPCVQVYQRAGLFCLGHIVEPRASADVSRTYDNFKEVHDALVRYLSYRYPKGAAGDLTEASEADFIARVKAELDTTLKGSKLRLVDPSTSAVNENDTSAASDDDLKAAFAQIEADRKTMQYGMVVGSLAVVGGKIDETKTNYREPCKGFLMLRKEVVVALKKTGLRWGGQDFGDMMHFDMGYETLNEFLDPPIITRAQAIQAQLSTSTDPTLLKLSDAAAAVSKAAETAGKAANAASLAGNTANEDACWAVVNNASSVLNKVDAALKAALKVAKDTRATDQKKQKVQDDADAALAAAKKVQDDANAAAAS